jgi:hypothetical protein
LGSASLILDQHQCIHFFTFDTAALCQPCTCLGLQAGKAQRSPGFVPQDEIHRPVAKVAHAIEKNNSFIHTSSIIPLMNALQIKLN